MSCSRGSESNPNFQLVNKTSRISRIIREEGEGEEEGGLIGGLR